MVGKRKEKDGGEGKGEEGRVASHTVFNFRP